MNVSMNKEKLLTILQGNRKRHRDVFNSACEDYRKQAIKEIEAMLADARAGSKIKRYVSLVEPMDQTRDYDRAIKMVQLDVRENIDLQEKEFAQYVMDDWAWKDQWTNSISPYFGGVVAQFNPE